MKKAFSKLTREDFQKFPVWEVADITQATPYAGELPLKPDNLRGFLVRTTVVLADKTKMTGTAIIGAVDKNELVGPTILSDSGEVNFTVSLKQATQENLDELTGHLGKPLSKIFPLQFETDVPMEGGPRKGSINGFLLDYRYKDMDREPHKVEITFQTAAELNSAIKRIKDEEAVKKQRWKLSKPEKALSEAAESGNVAEVRALLSNGVNLNRGQRIEIGPYPYIAKGVTALMLAAEKGHLEVMRALLDAGADVSLAVDTNEPGHSGKTALGYACFAEKIEAARLLLAAGADPNRKLAYGQSIFDKVCAEGSMELIQLLMAAGAKIDGAISSAVRANRLNVVRLLIEHKAYVNIVDRKGETVLMQASDRLNAEMVKLLLKAGADASMTRDNKLTALHYVVGKAMWLDPQRPADAEKISKAMEIVKALLERGADVNLPDARGETPFGLAKNKFCKLPELTSYLAGKA